MCKRTSFVIKLFIVIFNDVYFSHMVNYDMFVKNKTTYYFCEKFPFSLKLLSYVMPKMFM